MNERSIAVHNYERFCELEGSDYIASEFALETILKLIKNFDLNTILELGLGIGSISDTVLKYAKLKNIKINYVGTEQNEFCLEALPNNVLDYNQIELYKELSHIKNKKFDLIIIDGYDDSFKDIVAHCKKHTIIFIEGDRKGQTESIRKIFPKNRYVNVVTLRKNKPYSHGGGDINHYIGGGKLIFIDPTIKMKLFWFQEKVKAFIINKLRTE